MVYQKFMNGESTQEVAEWSLGFDGIIKEADERARKTSCGKS